MVTDFTDGSFQVVLLPLHTLYPASLSCHFICFCNTCCINKVNQIVSFLTSRRHLKDFLQIPECNDNSTAKCYQRMCHNFQVFSRCLHCCESVLLNVAVQIQQFAANQFPFRPLIHFELTLQLHCSFGSLLHQGSDLNQWWSSGAL